MSERTLIAVDPALVERVGATVIHAVIADIGYRPLLEGTVIWQGQQYVVEPRDARHRRTWHLIRSKTPPSQLDGLFERYHRDERALLRELAPFLVDQVSGAIPDTAGRGFEEPVAVRCEGRTIESDNPYDCHTVLTAWQEHGELRAILYTLDSVAGTEIVSWYKILDNCNPMDYN